MANLIAHCQGSVWRVMKMRTTLTGITIMLECESDSVLNFSHLSHSTAVSWTGTCSCDIVVALSATNGAKRVSRGLLPLYRIHSRKLPTTLMTMKEMNSHV